MAVPPPGRPLIDVLRDNDHPWLLKEVEEWLHPRKVEDVDEYEFISKYPEYGFSLSVAFIGESVPPEQRNTRTFYPPRLAQ